MVNIIRKLIKDKKVNIVAILCLVFFSLISIFPIGAIRSSTIVENTSEYLADVAENHTTNGTYAAMMIEPNDSTDKKINNPYNEFHYLYGIFREGLATYIGSVNADKTHSIKLKEIDDDVNFSFLNVDSGFGVKEYYKDKDGNMIYKQEFYPLELMFYSNHPMVDGMFSFFYISQRRADSILEKRGLPHETRDDYSKLLNTLTVVEFDGVEYKFSIDNIYLEQNYFYDAIDEVMGEFFCGGHRYPTGIKRQGLFFLRNYAYQNKFYIQYSTELYSQDEFDFKILDHNFKDNFKIDANKLIFVGNKSGDVWAALLLVIVVLGLLVATILIYFGAFRFNVRNTLFVGVTCLLPYFVFWIVHAITKSAILFSNFSTSCEIWCLLGLAVVYFVLFLVKRNRGVKEAE